jgi:thymidylate kinase
MPPHLFVLEGPDGVGKSAHAKRLVAVLRAAPPAVLVVDRWVTSTTAEALAMDPGAERAQLLGLAHAEAQGLPREHLVAVLDASEESLRWRLRARGEVVSVQRAARIQREREVYARLARERGWPIVSTARAPQETTAEIHGLVRVAMARGAA